MTTDDDKILAVYAVIEHVATKRRIWERCFCDGGDADAVCLHRQAYLEARSLIPADLREILTGSRDKEVPR